MPTMQTPAAKLDVTEISQVSAARRGRAWYKHLSIQILLAMSLGAIVGYLWPQSAEAWKPPGDLFISVVRMLVAPIIICTLVHAIANVGEAKNVRRVAVRSVIYLLVETIISHDLALIL